MYFLASVALPLKLGFEIMGPLNLASFMLAKPLLFNEIASFCLLQAGKAAALCADSGESSCLLFMVLICLAVTAAVLQHPCLQLEVHLFYRQMTY